MLLLTSYFNFLNHFKNHNKYSEIFAFFYANILLVVNPHGLRIFSISVSGWSVFHSLRTHPKIAFIKIKRKLMHENMHHSILISYLNHHFIVWFEDLSFETLKKEMWQKITNSSQLLIVLNEWWRDTFVFIKDKNSLSGQLIQTVCDK